MYGILSHQEKRLKVAHSTSKIIIHKQLYIIIILELQPLTLNPEPNSTSNPLPSLASNTTSGNIDGVIGYSYTCIDNGEVVVIYR